MSATPRVAAADSRQAIAGSGGDQAETVVAVLDGALLGALLKEVGRRASDLRRDLTHVLGWLEDAPDTP